METEHKVYENRVDVMIFDRSDPNQEIGWIPGKNGEPGQVITVLHEIHRGIYVRSDVAMLNFYFADGSFQQACIYFTREGIRWEDFQRYFTLEQQAELEAMRQRILSVCEIYPEMACYLGDRSWSLERRREINRREMAEFYMEQAEA